MLVWETPGLCVVVPVTSASQAMTPEMMPSSLNVDKLCSTVLIDDGRIDRNINVSFVQVGQS
jgi:hypothetical protein